ncbi:phosphatidylglycerol lysyltransferase domain-containing protein [Crossiella sp. CA198]|uniref:phosphatidylglycerol lysyltransferase domain-containing protein n=1 Tax=Crossiella sp. CA198 TaxID=3455607 RepID=UPI003F8D41B5
MTTTALDLLRAHGRSSSAFLAYNQDTEHFQPPGLNGLVAYRPAGRKHLVQLTGPCAAETDHPALTAAFREFAARQGRRITAVQLLREEAAACADLGYAVNQLGASFSIDLAQFTLRGGKLAETRNRLSQARRAGVVVTEESTMDSALAVLLAAIDQVWLRAKGRAVKQLGFMVGERGGRGAEHRRLFVARAAGRIVAYISFSPVYGPRPGWLYDLTRRHPEAPTGAIESIIAAAAEVFRDEGVGWLHLGFTPFVQLHPEHQIPGADNGILRRLMRQVAGRERWLYSARTQERFKTKWAPHHIEPEYLAFEHGLSLGAGWQLLRLIGAL